MLPASSLSSAAYSLRELFLQSIEDVTDINAIRIGHPADNIKELEELDQNCLNLFFYGITYDGYPADGNTTNPFYVHLYCLVTAIGHKSTEPETPGDANERDVSKGENELRMIGEVMRVLHEQPLLPVGDASGNDVAVLQVIPHTMNLDNLNHIWSTQNDIPYRLSVAYEMTLAPIPNAVPSDTSPLVGDPQFVARGNINRKMVKEKSGMISLQPKVEYIEVNTNSDDWIPHICYVENLADSTKKPHYIFKAVGDLNAVLDIVIAGKAGGKVKLLWDVWRKKADNSVVAWQEEIADVEIPIEKTIATPTGPGDAFDPGIIDPDNISTRSIFKARLPAAIKAADTKTWQAALHAVHDWIHPDSVDPGDSITTPIKSNTVLFYGGGV